VRRVTLTFDNGPEPAATPGVLDCLAMHGVKATFFVLGRKVIEEANARIAQRAHAEGHLIGNHTFSHSTPLGELDEAGALAEFERTEQALAWLHVPPLHTGTAAQPQRLFRPYGGKGTVGPHLLHPAVVEKMVAGGYTCVIWNSVPGDFRQPNDWVDIALADCVLRPWSLIVLHDLPNGAMAHLDEFIRRLRELSIEITQDFPPECTPIVNGTIVLPMAQYVSKRNA
jgi:peptidoglycan/xylan/chitin deacetylase (PgdA/CDA1 family)